MIPREPTARARDAGRVRLGEGGGQGCRRGYWGKDKGGATPGVDILNKAKLWPYSRKSVDQL